MNDPRVAKVLNDIKHLVGEGRESLDTSQQLDREKEKFVGTKEK